MIEQKKKIMFIMFPGFGVSKKGWDTHYEKDTDSYVKTDFISKFKKMGSVYFHEPLYHNIKHYLKNYKSKFLYDENTNFTKENLDVSKECEKVYFAFEYRVIKYLRLSSIYSR